MPPPAGASDVDEASHAVPADRPQGEGFHGQVRRLPEFQDDQVTLLIGSLSDNLNVRMTDMNDKLDNLLEVFENYTQFDQSESQNCSMMENGNDEDDNDRERASTDIAEAEMKACSL